MTNLFCHILCASFFAATAVLGVKTDIIFAIVEEVYGLTERDLKNSSFTDNTEWLKGIIPKEKREKIAELEEDSADVHSFVKKLLSTALDAADKDKTPEEAFKIVEAAYDDLSDDDKKVFGSTFPNAEDFLTGKAPTPPTKGNINKPMDKGEQKKNLKALIALLEPKKAVFENLIAYIQAFYDGVPWFIEDLTATVDLFEGAVDELKKSHLSPKDVDILFKGFATFGELAVSKKLMSRMKLSIILNDIKTQVDKENEQQKGTKFDTLLHTYAQEFTA